ncbi:MAG TPA: TIM barrel protein [Planctomycetota bacterium]|nr:TIM barrel protein [Planctomycetota bacterium]
MTKILFHPSVEGAQHGGKTLSEFCAFAKASGAAGAEPSNYLITGADGAFLSSTVIRNTFRDHGLLLDGISCHCPFWVHTTAWTESKTVLPFLPPSVRGKRAEEVEAWAEDLILRFYDLCEELNMRIIPMFFGVSSGWEVATGYPWAFWQGPGYNLVEEGLERFVKKTQRLRDEARLRGLYLCHEIHPNSAAMCAEDFQALLVACDQDPCLGITADPSHCWEHEDFESRFRPLASRVYAAAIKNFVIRPHTALRKMTGRWQDRAMQFVDLPSGDMNLVRFVELLVDIGYPKRYASIMGRETAPLIVEAESAYRDLDATSANGIRYVKDNLCFPVAESSFEDGMGSA